MSTMQRGIYILILQVQESEFMYSELPRDLERAETEIRQKQS